MSIKENDFDFESMKDKALEQLRSGESLYGKNGAFAPLMKKFLEAALEAEMENHMDDAQRSSGNRRNGRSNKEMNSITYAFSGKDIMDNSMSLGGATLGSASIIPIGKVGGAAVRGFGNIAKIPVGRSGKYS